MWKIRASLSLKSGVCGPQVGHLEADPERGRHVPERRHVVRLIADREGRPGVPVHRVVDPEPDVRVDRLRDPVVVPLDPHPRGPEGFERRGVNVLQRTRRVGPEPLADERLPLDAPPRVAGPSEIDPGPPDVLYHPVDQLGCPDLAGHHGHAEFDRSLRLQSMPANGAEPDRRPGFQVRQPVVLADPKLVVQGRRDRLAQGRGERDLGVLVRVQEPLDAGLAAENPDVPGRTQIAEREDRRVDRVEHVHLVAGREPPVVVLQFPEGVDREQPVPVLDDRVVVQVDEDEPAGLEAVDVRPGEQAEQGRLPGVGVERLGLVPEQRTGGQEERRPRGERPAGAIDEIGDDGPAQDELELFVPGRHRQVLPQDLDLLGQFLQGRRRRGGRGRFGHRGGERGNRKGVGRRRCLPVGFPDEQTGRGDCQEGDPGIHVQPASRVPVDSAVWGEPGSSGIIGKLGTIP